MPENTTTLVGCQDAGLAAFPDPIPGIIPFGTVTLFGGAPGVGKTAMLAEWCVRWRDRRPIFGHATNPAPGGMFYIASDRGWASAAHWFDKVGYQDIPHYALASDLTLNLDDLKEWKASLLFEKCLDRLGPPPGAHVLVDPMAPLFIAGDPNRTRDVAKSLLIFSRVCQQRRINITATCHFGKQRADPKDRYSRPQDRIAGSTSFAGFSDTQIYLVDPEPPDHPNYRLGWVPRHAPMAEFELMKNAHGLFIPVTLAHALSPSAERVYQELPAPNEDPIAVELLLARVQLSRRSVFRALGELIQEGRAVKVAYGMYRRCAAQ